ncbi:Beta-fructosidase [Hyphodiscus hymeniophilus]|uniref:beta-fructofuranosidase n=1 Tax=Hyphodiscus hymeniophilus TaxID=353542 RepID=A0A9P6VC94_9HELO|nr:Beta-fructosidase [Hyphodiscus hymeniophilus]
MKYNCCQGGLLTLFLSWSSILPNLSTLANASPISGDCHHNHFDGPENPSFENGLNGWTVLQGDGFGNNSVSTSTTYWDGPFRKVGNAFLWGFGQAGDAGTGSLRSSSFSASSVMSFLIGGGWDPISHYIALIRESDSKMLFKQTGSNDEAMVRIIWDTSAYAGHKVHLLVYDNSTAGFGHINIDDVRTGCDALGDKGLTFHVLGQANQPDQTASRLSAPQLYAADPIRDQYHYTPYQGWINDPAGLIQWHGQHQLFSQFNPVAPVWGPMHWSHANSPDAVHWHNLPIALYPPYPNNTADTSGRFTGSAYTNSNTGDIQLIFTESTDVDFHPGDTPEEVFSANSKNGVDFGYSPKNPLIAAPPPGSESGFRDPKVYWDPTDSTWKMVVGSGDANSGKVQLYVSKSPKGAEQLIWDYVGVLFEGDGSTGTMWECPNFFPIGNKWVLFYGGANLGWYHVGSYNGSTFVSEKSGLADAGPDSYAMQWYVDDGGRNLAITWMGNWPTPKWPSRVNGWAGVQSITRELYLRQDGGLGSRPIKELASLASGRATVLSNKAVHGSIKVGSTTMARLQLTVNLAASNAPAFNVSLFGSSAESAVLMYNFANKTLTLDTTNAGYGQAGTWTAQIATPASNELTLDIFIDRSSMELFAGDGTVMTAKITPRYQESQDIKIIANGGKAVFDTIQLIPLSSSWT